ncbi:MAG: polyprenyl synthetase family protein [Deltaproteobacteria bacterium]|nr:polyprenyl synthetase family protein [Deltaproteobacteria bacterium]
MFESKGRATSWQGSSQERCVGVDVVLRVQEAAAEAFVSSTEHGKTSDQLDVDAWLESVRARVEPELVSALARLAERTRAKAPAAEALVSEIGALTLRAGKRFRPALVFAGFSAISEADSSPITPAAVATELLQTHLLIQDDWMDEDVERRGGPTAHIALRRSSASIHEADSSAILASDLALSEALWAISSVELPAPNVLAATRALIGSLEDVVLGQYLDLKSAVGVTRVFDLKTTSYTVRGPLRVGAILAGATSEAVLALDEYAVHLGFAFQLRDDLLGVFGDPQKTLKPVGADLVRNKRTSIVEAAESRLDDAGRTRLRSLLGSSKKVLEARDLLIEVGAKTAVEEELTRAAMRAKDALVSAPLLPKAKDLLSGLATRLTRREV